MKKGILKKSERKPPPPAVSEEMDRMFAMSIALEEAEGGDSLYDDELEQLAAIQESLDEIKNGIPNNEVCCSI